MFLLDTNMLDLFVGQHPAVVRRVRENIAQIWVSSVVAEETLTGRLSGINKARDPKFPLSLPQAHEDFTQALVNLRFFPTSVYSDEAETIYRTFSAKILRIGSQDCRIAAQAIAHGFTVITRNLSDFEGIGAPCADWSQ